MFGGLKPGSVSRRFSKSIMQIAQTVQQVSAITQPVWYMPHPVIGWYFFDRLN